MSSALTSIITLSAGVQAMGVPRDINSCKRTQVAILRVYLTECMAFFDDASLRYHARSDFGNVLTGLEYLRCIWKNKRAGSGELQWTAVFPQMRVITMRYDRSAK